MKLASSQPDVGGIDSYEAASGGAHTYDLHAIVVDTASLNEFNSSFNRSHSASTFRS